jgi:hypothetical protein
MEGRAEDAGVEAELAALTPLVLPKETAVDGKAAAKKAKIR